MHHVIYETLDRGLTDYQESLNFQRSLFEKRKDGIIGDRLIITRHKPTITLGKSANEGDLLASESYLNEVGVDLCRINRGGGITYHGPGQVVLYPIFDLRGYRKDLRDFIFHLGNTMVDAAASLGVELDYRTGDDVGVWRKGTRKKIGSIGISVKRWITMHGFAFNVDLDEEKSGLIRPCGLHNVEYVSLSDYCDVDTQGVTEVLLDSFRNNMEEFKEGK